MDGEVDGAQTTGQEQQGQQGDQAAGDERQKQQEALQVGAVPTDEEIRAALAERDQKIAELERRVAEASKTAESAEALARQIEELRAASEEELVGFELNLPARLSRAGRNTKEVMIPEISVTGLGDYARNVGYKTGSIGFSYEQSI